MYDNDNDGLLIKAPIEAIADNPLPLPEANLQSKALLEIQRAASDTERPRLTLPENSDSPNLLPSTEIEDPPVPGA